MNSTTNNILKSRDLSVYSSINRDAEKIILGLFIQNKSNQNLNKFDLMFSNNSFGLCVDSIISSPGLILSGKGEKIFYGISIDNSKSDKRQPSVPYNIEAKIITNFTTESLSIPLNINSLFIETGKMANKPFVDFFSINKDHSFNETVTYSQLKSGFSVDSLNRIFERNNIFLVAKQNKFDPPMMYYSLNISGVIPVIIECSFLKDQKSLKTKVISAIECITKLTRNSLDLILA
jgi:hypothetical protein